MTHLIRLADLATVLRLARQATDRQLGDDNAIHRVTKAHAELVAIDHARTKDRT